MNLIVDIFWTFIIPTVCVCSLFSNCINILILNKLRKINKIYRLFFIKSIINAIYLFCSAFIFVIRCGRFCSTLKDSHLAQVYRLYVLYYFIAILGFFDLIIDFVISLNRYLKLTKNRFLKTAKYYFYFFLIMGSIIINLFTIVFYEIVPIANINNNSSLNGSMARYEVSARKKYLLESKLSKVIIISCRFALICGLIAFVNILFFTKLTDKTKNIVPSNEYKLIVISK
jgi:hypothetical protein